jgi:hypothetical protein
MRRRMLANITILAFVTGGMATRELRGQVAALDVTIREVQQSSSNCIVDQMPVSESACTVLVMGEITAVNGQSVGGIWLQKSRRLNLRASGNDHDFTLTPLVSISERLDFRGMDGAIIGGISATHYTLGLGEVAVPSTLPVIGDSGIYVGAQGYMTRHVSDHTMHWIVTLLSARQPLIATVDNSPAIFDTTMMLISPTNPARIGQSITLLVQGLGPTTPDPGEGRPFPADPVAKVNAPLQATIGGRAAELLAAVGDPGQTGVYRVDLRVPDDVMAGMAVVQLITAFIPSAPVEIPVHE